MYLANHSVNFEIVFGDPDGKWLVHSEVERQLVTMWAWV